ncbi:hypothetical protein P8C59_008291 [Phyllachora maydis]|uniref:Ketoreductase domain-containing protein n=1 Tax=Phyllachora maydis TaxID=1825666 RepID=A0AAD9MEF3_9PEZI|nr:hypothetical protein P8C59_008291 [Phyllachora maydis]
MKIAGRTFIVSGGASGLGRACVEDFCRAGGHAVILDRNEDQGNRLVQQLGSSARFWICDVTDTANVAQVVQAAVEWAKETGKPLGGVIPAAGVGNPALMLDSKGTPFSMASVDFVLNINLRGTLDLVRQVLPHLAAGAPAGADGERGVVVMVASAAAFEGQMGQVAYAASKGAVASMTLPMARDLARHGIRVVTIAPSMFDSAMTAAMSDKVKLGLRRAMEFPARPGKPAEFASLVRQSVENSMLNGVVIRLDGATRMPSRL